MLRAGIKHAKENGISRLEADTLTKNKPTIRIVEKVGFKLEGIRKKRIKMNKRYEDEVLLGMILTHGKTHNLINSSDTIK